MKKPASNFFRKVLCVTSLVIAPLINHANAGIVTWDPQANNPQNPFLGSLSGSWEGANWDTADQLGVASPGAWVESSTALFAVNSGTGTPAFIVTMNSAHTVAGIDNGSQTPGPCTVTINGTATMTLPAGLQTFNINSPGAVTISNVVAGTGQLVLAGSGTLTLTGTNTFSGASTINSSCVLNINGAGKLGNGTYSPAFTNNGNFNYNSSSSQTLSGVMLGAGALAVNGSGTLTMTKANTFSGGTTINTGSTLTLGSGGTLNSAGNILDNGTFNYNNPASWTLNGTLSGSGSLSVQPSGAQGLILTLGGINSYTGKTTMNPLGQIVIFNDNSLGTPPATFVSNQLTMTYGFIKASGTFSFSTNRGIFLAGGVQTIGASFQVNPGNTLTFPTPITGVAGIGVIFGSGEATFGQGTNFVTANSTYTGPTVISTGRLLLGVNGALPTGTTMVMVPDNDGGSFFDMNGFNQTIGPLSTTNTLVTNILGNGTPTILLSGALTILQTNTSTVFNGLMTGSGSLTINGNASGTLSLTNYANDYTGGTIINGGTLDISTGNSSIAGNVTVNGGTLKLDNNLALSPFGTLTLNSSVTVNLNYSGTMTNGGLTFVSTPQAPGLWGAPGNLGATFTDSRFTGTGLLLVCPAPQTITPATASVCAGTTTTASVPNTPGATYSWSIINGTVISGANSNVLTYSAWANNPVTLNCVVTSSCGVQSPGNQNTTVTVDICGQIVQATNIVSDPVNGVTIGATGVMGANWFLNASTNVNAPLPWPTIQSGFVSGSPFTISDPNAVNVPTQFYYLTNSDTP